MTAPNRTWPRFSLRTLFVVVTLSCLALGTWILARSLLKAEKAVRSRQTIAEYIVERGGTVTYADDPGKDDSTARLPWLRRAMGDRPVKTIGVGIKTWMVDQLWDQAESLFPEAEKISLAPINPDDPLLSAIFGGPTNLEIIRHPDRVEAHRLLDQRGDSYGRNVDDYPTTGPALPLSAELASRLSYDLSYCWNGSIYCLPVPDVRVTFYRGDDRIDLLFCFGCDLLKIFRDGEYVDTGFIQDSRNEIVATMKVIFPDDPFVQGLKNKPARVRHLQPKPTPQS